ncbi:MAG: family 43 glycosylhydrolase [Mucilaginibacter polytrichastri]|nr:family 43 glycosylhydrolase [Mucilaginibacter polytrichastri]
MPIHHKLLCFFCCLFFGAGINAGHAQTAVYETPQISGDFVHIFNPNDSRSAEDTTWYTNDHCFAKAPDGTWHAYGIIGHKPIDPWKGETRLFHASGKSLTKGGWKDNGDALTALPGKERVLWAPFIIKKQDTWYMFYNTGNMQPNAPEYSSWGNLCVATSNDLYTWQRHDRNPLFSDAGHARDSYILKQNGKFYYYYTRTYSEVDQRSTVAMREGPDLLHWSGPKPVHVQPLKNHYGGDAESSFVIERNGIFYLFICRANTHYNRTDVYWSKDNEDFPLANFVCQLPVHAAEVIYDAKEGWFISNTGWDKKGLYVAPLKWSRK